MQWMLQIWVSFNLQPNYASIHILKNPDKASILQRALKLYAAVGLPSDAELVVFGGAVDAGHGSFEHRHGV